jgi:hypothetical protein
MRLKLLAKIMRAFLFTERRRRDRTDSYLLIRDFGCTRFKELKAGAHLRRDEKLSEDLFWRERGGNHNQ